MIRPRVHLGPMQRGGAEIAVEMWLTGPNERLIRALGLPRLYKAGVRYTREEPGGEEWQSARLLLTNREGDCEDLAAYLAAEMRVYDRRNARVVIRPNRSGGYHAVVEDQDGAILDPSQVLGM